MPIESEATVFIQDIEPTAESLFPESTLAQWLRIAEAERNKMRTRFLESAVWQTVFNRINSSNSEVGPRITDPNQILGRVIEAADIDEPIEKKYELRHEIKDDIGIQQDYQSGVHENPLIHQSIVSPATQQADNQDGLSLDDANSGHGTDESGKNDGFQYSLSTAVIGGGVIGCIVLLLLIFWSLLG